MIHDCIVVEPLTDMSIDSGDFMESDVAMDEEDGEDGVEERMEGSFIGE